MTVETKTKGPERASEKKQIAPDVDIYEREDGIILIADMPGVDEKTVEILLEKNVLSISGRTADSTPPEGVSPVYLEFDSGDYQRSFTLASEYDSDKIEAVVKNGALRVFLPRQEPERRQISVKAG